VQPLARMGGLITGIDAVEKNLGVASLHAVFLSVSLSSPVLISNFLMWCALAVIGEVSVSSQQRIMYLW
jgi:hypothetical protein